MRPFLVHLHHYNFIQHHHSRKTYFSWNQTHVRDWLISHGLVQMSQLFANFDGRSLMYMNETIEKVELQQVVALLQEDSLRRTCQTLSLVEFSEFRSLMEQRKQSFESYNNN